MLRLRVLQLACRKATSFPPFFPLARRRRPQVFPFSLVVTGSSHRSVQNKPFSPRENQTMIYPLPSPPPSLLRTIGEAGALSPLEANYAGWCFWDSPSRKLNLPFPLPFLALRGMREMARSSAIMLSPPPKIAPKHFVLYSPPLLIATTLLLLFPRPVMPPFPLRPPPRKKGKTIQLTLKQSNYSENFSFPPQPFSPRNLPPFQIQVRLHPLTDRSVPSFFFFFPGGHLSFPLPSVPPVKPAKLRGHESFPFFSSFFLLSRDESFCEGSETRAKMTSVPLELFFFCGSVPWFWRAAAGARSPGWHALSPSSSGWRSVFASVNLMQLSPLTLFPVFLCQESARHPPSIDCLRNFCISSYTSRPASFLFFPFSLFQLRWRHFS